MARYIKDFQVSVDPQIVHSAINQYMQSEGYEYINYDGENVFKKGNGVMSNPSFFKFSYVANSVRMETWMKYAFFPGVYVGELGVDGFVGCAVKGPWKNRIKTIENILFNFSINTSAYSSTHGQDIVAHGQNNETQILNDNNDFEGTCIMDENKAKTVASNSLVFCTGCGNQMPDGALFCSVCGQKRAEEVPIINEVQTQNTNSQTFMHQSTYEAPVGVQLPPLNQQVSKKDFIKFYAQPSLRKNITSIAILCYVCAGITFLLACLVNPLGIIDALVLASLALGMHLAKSKGFAIAILVLSIIECIAGLAMGSFPFWWLIAGVSAVVTFNKLDKQYKQFLNR